MVHGVCAEVLLGLTEAGQILVVHPDDECFIQVLAYNPMGKLWRNCDILPGLICDNALTANGVHSAVIFS